MDGKGFGGGGCERADGGVEGLEVGGWTKDGVVGDRNKC
jgi:hypothetical protein